MTETEADVLEQDLCMANITISIVDHPPEFGMLVEDGRKLGESLRSELDSKDIDAAEIDATVPDAVTRGGDA